MLVGLLPTSYEVEDCNGDMSYVVTAIEPWNGRKISMDEESPIMNQ